MGEPESPGRLAGRSGTVLLVLLLVLSVAAFAATRVLRSEDDIVNTVIVSEHLDPGGEAARIRFRLTRADARADVLILDEAGAPVRALALGVPLEAGPHSFRWDGRADDGEDVAPGDYRIRVVLGEQGREIEPPGTIEVGR